MPCKEKDYRTLIFKVHFSKIDELFIYPFALYWILLDVASSAGYS